MENSNFYIKIFNKIFSIILFFSSISIFLVLFSFHPEDPGWGVVSENIPKNFYGEIGSFFSGLVIREFGILPGLFLSSILLIFFKEDSVKYAGIPFTIALKPAVDCKLTKDQACLSSSSKGILEYLL